MKISGLQVKFYKIKHKLRKRNQNTNFSLYLLKKNFVNAASFYGMTKRYLQATLKGVTLQDMSPIGASLLASSSQDDFSIDELYQQIKDSLFAIPFKDVSLDSELSFGELGWGQS